MPKHRRYNWPQLFAEYEQSGLSQAEFCKTHDLNPKVKCAVVEPPWKHLSMAKRSARKN